MNSVTWFSFLIFGVLFLLVARCGTTERMRYEMVVEVETPAGLRTGSAVREVSYVHSSPLAIFTKDGVWVEGEAVAVDLPGGRTLFAALSSDDKDADFAARLPLWLMNWRRDGATITEPVELYPNSPTNTRPRLSPEGKRPMLVTFRDLNDPISVVRVEPGDLAAQFGAGVQLRRITVQATDKDVTEGIEQRLPWLSTAPTTLVRQPFNTPMGNMPREHLLGSWDFKRGD